MSVVAGGMSDADVVRGIAAEHAAGGARGPGCGAMEADLCRRFAPRIRLYGLRHLGGEDRARDLVQSVLLAVLVAVRGGRVEDPDRIDRFVLGTCRNTSLRTRQVEARATLVPDEQLDVVTFLRETEMVDTGGLMRCLAALDSRGRTVVNLSFNEQRSAEEIARVLQTTAGNVRVVRHRAIAALRRCLGVVAVSGNEETRTGETLP